MAKPNPNSHVNGPMFESWESFATGDIVSSIQKVTDQLRKQNLSEEEIDDKLSQIIAESIQTAITETAPSITKSLLRDAPRMLAEHRGLREGFEFRLRWIWGEALDLLYGVMVCCSELGEGFIGAYYDDAESEEDYRFEALIRLHARACMIASEIHSLLRSGHAWGAQARWRTLHEISVVATILGEGDQELSRRYLIHCRVEECRDIELDLKHRRSSDNESGIEKELENIAKIRSDAKVEFGPVFKKSWGWSAVLFDKGDPTFERLENLAELEGMRPDYRLSSHLIHAGSTGISMMLRESDEGRFFMTGSSNDGLSQPGQCCAISMLQITAALVTYARPDDVNPLVLAGLSSIKILQEQAVRELISAERRVEELTEERRLAISSGQVSKVIWYSRIQFEQRVWQASEFIRLQYSRTRRLLRRHKKSRR